MWEGVPVLKRGSLRLLTSGEVRLATELYGYSIQYNRVWVHHGSYLPFGMQENNTALTPNGEIWFESRVYSDDFSLVPVEYQHMFMHEMMHVWQYQRGMNVRMRGLVSWAVDYKYDLTKCNLRDYAMEKQASIVADYWLLNNFGFRGYNKLINYKGYKATDSISSVYEKYKKILKGFPS